MGFTKTQNGSNTDDTVDACQVKLSLSTTFLFSPPLHRDVEFFKRVFFLKKNLVHMLEIKISWQVLKLELQNTPQRMNAESRVYLYIRHQCQFWNGNDNIPCLIKITLRQSWSVCYNTTMLSSLHLTPIYTNMVWFNCWRLPNEDRHVQSACEWFAC